MRLVRGRSSYFGISHAKACTHRKVCCYISFGRQIAAGVSRLNRYWSKVAQ